MKREGREGAGAEAGEEIVAVGVAAVTGNKYGIAVLMLGVPI